MTTTETIHIDPSDPIAGLWGTTTGASAEEIEELTGMVKARGARVVAVELLSAAAAATGWTWGDETLAALTRALAALDQAENTATIKILDITTGDTHDVASTTRAIPVAERDLGDWQSGGAHDDEIDAQRSVSLSAIGRGEYALVVDESIAPDPEHGRTWWLSRMAW